MTLVAPWMRDVACSVACSTDSKRYLGATAHRYKFFMAFSLCDSFDWNLQLHKKDNDNNKKWLTDITKIKITGAPIKHIKTHSPNNGGNDIFSIYILFAITRDIKIKFIAPTLVVYSCCWYITVIEKKRRKIVSGMAWTIFFFNYGFFTT